MDRRAFIMTLAAGSAGSSIFAAPGATLQIRVGLLADRRQYGSLALYDSAGVRLAGPFQALGMADSRAAKNHNNKDRNPLLPYGHTPYGSYIGHRLLRTGANTRLSSLRTYGPNGALWILPQAGDAAIAAAAGRTGLLIHGGDLAPGARLRATNGCIRLSNDDMATLVSAILIQGSVKSCTVGKTLEVVVGGIGGEDPTDVYDEGDPPPIAENDPILP